jgi:di/tricarboxylate transporter
MALKLGASGKTCIANQSAIRRKNRHHDENFTKTHIRSSRMNWEGWVTLAVVAVMIGVLVKDLLPPSASILGSTILLLLAGVLTPEQAFSGFSNMAPITVAALYVVARGADKTGALQPIVGWLLSHGGGRRSSLTKLLASSAAASAFLNNTPIVAMLVPQVTEWAQRRGESPSCYLMPLSFAVILGGAVTAIGTSTNLLVSGMLEARGLNPIGMFEIARLGLPMALAGLVLLVILAPILLPVRRPAWQQLEDDVREFAVHMEVIPGGPLDGKTVEGAGLRHLQGVFLAELERDDEFIAPVSPTTVLRGRDRLVFVGKADLVVDLQSTRGLVSSEQTHFDEFDTTRHTFFEAVVGEASPLVGKTLLEAGFRERYQGAVVAIHRAGQRVRAKLGQVRIHVGDTLLLLTDAGFRNRWRDRNDFLLVSRLGGTPPGATRKAGLVGIVLLGIVVVAGVGILPILHASLVGGIALVLFGVLTPGEARDAVDLDVILVIAGALGLGAAIQTSGLADRLAAILIGASSAFGPLGVLLGLIVATVVLTEVITNNAAAALIFPIALSTAAELGLDPRPFAIAIAVSASASFLTPIGYQTNTMVYGPGGYQFGDYIRLGAPLTVIAIAAIMAAVPYFWPI